MECYYLYKFYVNIGFFMKKKFIVNGIQEENEDGNGE